MANEDRTPSATQNINASFVASTGSGISPLVEGRILLGLIVAGAILRSWQYAADTSLFGDEIALTVGLMRAQAAEVMTAPLPLNQVAPGGFRLAQKLMILAFGPAGYAVRFVPFVLSLAGLVAFARLARRLLDGIGPIVAVLLFATAVPMILYGVMAKQYSGDVCVAIVFMLCVEGAAVSPPTQRQVQYLAGIGAVLAWCSQPFVMSLVACGALFAWWGVTDPSWRPARVRVGVLLVIWAASVVGVVAAGFASMTPGTRAYMHDYWQGGFPPLPLSPVVLVRWLAGRLGDLFGRNGEPAGLYYPQPWLYVGIAAAGIIALWQRRRTACLLLCGPALVALVAAFGRQYPFSGRLLLFIYPSVFLLIGAAVERLREAIARRGRGIATAVCAVPVALAVGTTVATPPPYLVEDVGPALAWLKSAWKPGDRLYVQHRAVLGAAFYADRSGLASNEYQLGGCYVDDIRGPLKELDHYRGRRRLWVLFKETEWTRQERHHTLQYLDEIGTRLTQQTFGSRAVGWNPPSSELYLYDLGQSTSSALASTFPLDLPYPQPSCRSNTELELMLPLTSSLKR